MRDRLQTLLAQLRFHGIAAALDAEIERAEREAAPPVELLQRLHRRDASAVSPTVSTRYICRGAGRSTASRSNDSQASTRRRSTPLPASTSYAAPIICC